MMLATLVVKTLGRSCSSSDARLPDCLAASYWARAFGLAFDLGLDRARADLHAHGVHSRARAGREHVDGLDGVGAGVLEDLVYLYARR